jgi:hypothetical protein
MARRGVFVRAEAVALLEEAARWRRQCVDVLSRTKPQGLLYNAITGIVGTIDGLAEVVPGDRKRFHQVSPRTLRPDLSPGKWRTVE